MVLFNKLNSAHNILTTWTQCNNWEFGGRLIELLRQIPHQPVSQFCGGEVGDDVAFYLAEL